MCRADHGEPYQRIEHRGRQFQIRLIRDEDHGAPWDEEDGHGPVSDWTRREKAPGERVLVSDRDAKRYYDVQAAMAIALRDGWGPPAAEGTTETKRQQAARAVEADYQRLRDWCRDEWWYVGVVVDLLDADGHTTGYRSAGLWGIESDAGDYLIDVAREEADQLLAELPAQLDAAAQRIERLRSLQITTD